MGGKIALAIAAKQTKAYRQLVYIAPAPPAPELMDEKKTQSNVWMLTDEEALKKLAKDLLAVKKAGLTFLRA